MKKIDTSPISTSIAFPIKSGTLQHIQSAYQEALAQTTIAQIGAGYDATKCYILYGLVNSGIYPIYNITAGAVFFNGEVYLVDTSSGTLTGANVVVGIITGGFFVAANADPVTFTDGVIRNVHQIVKVTLQPGLAGSGIADYNNFRIINPSTNIGIGEMKLYVGSISDFSGGLGVAANVRGWAICDGSNGTYDMRGRGPMGYNSSDSDFNAVGTKTGGEKTHTLTISELAAHTHDWSTVSSNDNLGGSGFVASANGSDGNPPGSLSSTNSTIGGDAPHNNLQPYRVVLFIQRIY